MLAGTTFEKESVDRMAVKETLKTSSNPSAIKNK